MFMQKPKVVSKSILRNAAETEESQPLPTNLSIIRDDASGCLITDPKEVIRQIQKLETKAISPDPALPPGASFPRLSHITPNQRSTIPMIPGRITPAILQEALRRTPNHKAAGLDRVPELILKHMPPAFHEALQLLFQAMYITRITP
jgi:hypothetical protein